ncbi:class I SAM-dependent methyltransferase [Streptomonospora sp. PA3]|uniref:class I SAM-dependent methyltransferase n=1 Tax=Streptomonospora sp. PA3 TaxID=2607326 RepID=UPI0016431EC2|nr:class I SAM-dependent methyltransferase [Streptomonospora sp. PA3]
MAEQLAQAWEHRAAEWIAWTRTAGHDVYFSELNWPSFTPLLPPPGRLTLDLGCGEGRVGRLLASAGHRVMGVDSSPTLARRAHEAGGYERVLHGSGTALPVRTGSADLIVAFMSLHDMDDPAAAISECARVLTPGGLLCAAIVHPLNRPAEHLTPYFAQHRLAEHVETNGLTMTFEAIDRPLDTYTRALEAAGFVIESLREPRPDEAAVRSEPRLAPAAQHPFFLHLRCRR